MTVKSEEMIHVIAQLNSVLMQARQSGHFFSLFDILGIHEKELIHSRFISTMLDPYGSHGQGRRYLEIFLTILKSHLPLSCSIKKLQDSDRISIETEVYVGQVDLTNKAGGRIDIVIRYETNTIFIENKIYAEDQPDQLIRYHRHNPEATLLYLTLYGVPASNISTGPELILNKDYFSISYKEFIKEWIQGCMKISSELTELMMAFKSYEKCVNAITWSDDMSKEIFDKIITPETIQSVMQLLSMKDDLLNAMRNMVIQQLNDIAHELDLSTEYDIDSFLLQGDTPYRMTCNTWGDIAIGIVAANKEKEMFISGVCYCIHSKKGNSGLRKIIEKIPNMTSAKDDGEDPAKWPYYKYFEGRYRDWSLDSPIWNDIVTGNFKKSAKSELEKLKNIVNQILA